MNALFSQLDYWHYLIAAVLLMLLEVFAPGFIFLWIGVSAAVVGVLLWLFPGITWEYQFLLLSVLSIVSIFAWRVYSARHPVHSDQPTLNRRGQQYVGRVFTLQSPVTDGVGKVNVDDSTWKVMGADCPAGSRVRVVRTEGTILHVEVVES